MNKGESNKKRVPTLNKRCEGPNKRANLDLNFSARSSAELSKIFKIKQEEVEKIGKNKVDVRQLNATHTAQSEGNINSLKRKLFPMNATPSQVTQKEDRQHKSTKMHSQVGGATQMGMRQPLPTNVTQTQVTQMEKRQPKSTKMTAQVGGSSEMAMRQPLFTNMTQTRVTQMEVQGDCLMTPSLPLLKETSGKQVLNEKKRQSITTSVNQGSNQNDHGPKVKRMNAICPAMSVDDFLEENGVYEEENQLVHDEEQEAKNERVVQEVGEVGQNHQVDDNLIDQDVDREEVEEMDNNPEGSVKKKKTRGKTECKEIHARSKEEREEIIFERRVAIGPTDKSISNLSLFLGTIARNSKFCPLNYTNFKAIPKSYTDNVMKYVQSKFIIPKEGEDWVLSGVKEAWKRHKCKIKKKHFKPYDNIEDMLKNRPRDVPISIFKKLIAYWSLPAIQTISKMNSENRKRLRWNHRMGPMNFARVRNRLRLANENDDVTQVDLFITTRTGTKGKELDLETKSAINEVKDRIENSRENADEAFQAVFGKEKPGRVRGYGRGVTKTSFKMDAKIDTVKRKHSEEMLTLKTEMENQKQDTDNQMNNMKKQVEGLENLVKALLQRANPGVNLEDLTHLMRSSPADANSAPNMDKSGLLHSSTSMHIPSQEK